jgi:phosphoglycolate phosphatase
MKIRIVIFDLDGTLIDSAPSILGSVKVAFEEQGIKPTKPLVKELIGPPLGQMVAALLPKSNIEAQPTIIESFKRHYDEIGYRRTRVYEGISEMLSEIRNRRLGIYIATNKRLIPTRKIIKHLGWSELFSGVFSLDFFNPSLERKSTMLERVCLQLQTAQNQIIYVGDTAEDAEAAKFAQLPFLFASWGYGSLEGISRDVIRLEKPEMFLGWLEDTA